MNVMNVSGALFVNGVGSVVDWVALTGILILFPGIFHQDIILLIFVIPWPKLPDKTQLLKGKHGGLAPHFIILLTLSWFVSLTN